MGSQHSYIAGNQFKGFQITNGQTQSNTILDQEAFSRAKGFVISSPASFAGSEVFTLYGSIEDDGSDLKVIESEGNPITFSPGRLKTIVYNGYSALQIRSDINATSNYNFRLRIVEEF